ncbi:arylamine N-acetyltransferase [bacterium]|nr:arylamine N-acetyltransferase [bacterium]
MKSQEVIEPIIFSSEAFQFLKEAGIDLSARPLDKLAAILKAFSRFPYENLSKIIKYRNRNDHHLHIRMPDEVFADFDAYGLGGTCFSLTYTLLSILGAAGFDAYPVMADMRYGPNTHCALVLRWGGEKFLLDPGYLLVNPLRLNEHRLSQIQTSISTVELDYDKITDYYHLSTIQTGERKWRYKWRDIPAPSDVFYQHWLDSFTWNGMRGLCLNKITNDRMIYVHRDYLRETSPTGKRSKKIKTDYHNQIHQIFGIDAVIVEEALAAVNENLANKRETGLHAPGSGSTP